MAIKTNTLVEAREVAKQLVAASDQVAATSRAWTALGLTYSDADVQAFDPLLTAAQVNAAATVLADFNTWLQSGTRLKDLLVLRG
jgi:hypothetical protein